MKLAEYDVIVVGGGLFGICAALRLSKRLRTVVIEAEDDILTGASFINQNRLHSGFHYPRSVDTAFESLDAYEPFDALFGHCLRLYENYYGVVQEGSLTSPEDYAVFLDLLKREKQVVFERVDASQWFLKPGRIASLYRVREPIVDIDRVRSYLKEEVDRHGQVTLRTGVRALELESNQPYVVSTTADKFRAPILVNATYGNPNWHRHANSPQLEIQLVEMVMLRSKLRVPGITLMDGPFCGILPYGFSNETYWYYSVNHSVHARVLSNGPVVYRDPFLSNWPRMLEQGDRYFTFMSKLENPRSWFTPRTLLVSPEVDRTRARPSVIFELEKGFFQILGGKLVTCLTAAEGLEKRICG